MNQPRTFAENPWFQSLPPAEVDALLSAATPRQLTQGEFLYRQGDIIGASQAAFFGVACGLLKLCILHPDGNEAILTITEPGNWVGEVALLDRMRRAHTAIAPVDTELLTVTAGKFNELMQRAPFAHAIAKLVAGRLRMTYGLMSDSALQSKQERVARRLLLLARGDMTESADERCIITTSQDTLAMMLNISRPTLNKELQALVKLGAIALRYGHIEIRDMPLLQQKGQGTAGQKKR
ncbi:Crp/Fnr family transcriptional regulator [Paraburkholderia panacisoli]|jgi:CRP/FNR family cyclic AMP-dependent transcriptional regulator|uniref:Crp/Fnr family transcriptional regulator n=1 Tax=Paraburkholderia panacisoli TaxID=2603818 RepID=A0A5B0H8M7_9BURK|nr:Crp/Fnr family transcriptional regulator [Paraburkholderia panacisoli]KAA1011462.1 Crp/Fnr family transcriptional regulator [Paraburkholderia panacisoli]